jgi:hypothetical protein
MISHVQPKKVDLIEAESRKVVIRESREEKNGEREDVDQRV